MEGGRPAVPQALSEVALRGTLLLAPPAAEVQRPCQHAGAGITT